METTNKQRALLAELGFVRVDGLKSRDPFCPSDGPRKLEAQLDHLGRWNANNGMVVLTTLSGEIWLAAHPGTDVFWHRFEPVANELCPKGHGAFVPCSNGETLSWDETMKRLSDPDWQPA